MDRADGQPSALRNFRAGAVAALPVCAGYFGVGFAIAVAARAALLPGWAPALMAASQYSGTSSGATVTLTAAGAGFWSVVAACLVLNLRYVLLSLALGQRLDPRIGFWRRLVLAHGVTDENVALALSLPAPVPFALFFGIASCALLGWVGGSVFGTLGADLLPASALAPLGVALYAMFVAIVTPAARASRPVLACVATAVALNLLLRRALPASARPAPAVAMLLSGTAAALVCAFLFPSRGSSGAPGNPPDPSR